VTSFLFDPCSASIPNYFCTPLLRLSHPHSVLTHSPSIPSWGSSIRSGCCLFQVMPFSNSIRSIIGLGLAIAKIQAFSPTRQPLLSRLLLAISETKEEEQVVGAKFFGGNQEKDEFYDAVAEEAVLAVASATTVDRFQDDTAFANSQLARDLQAMFLSESSRWKDLEYTYLPNVQWDSPFPGETPLQAWNQAQDFYTTADLAIVSVTEASNDSFQVRWQASVLWPTIWAPQVVVTGVSNLRLKGSQIVHQTDVLDNPDLIAHLTQQLSPRFWDLYHIGMSPTAELTSMDSTTKPFAYETVTIPPTWYWQVSRLDTGTRRDATAATLPNHAFVTNIVTMGPRQETYVPATPVQVAVENTEQGRRITWRIPIATTCLAQLQLPLGIDDEEEEDTKDILPSSELDPGATAEYVFESQPQTFRVAPHGGFPQDESVSDVRKRLYEKHIGGNDPPVFSYWMYKTKACWTKQGLGMCVYEWRPQFVECNRVALLVKESSSIMK